MILGRLLKRSFHIKFKDRTSAGQILANVLGDSFKKEGEKARITVLAIPRGGVIIADAIASKFRQSEFDIVVPRKLGAPNNPELAIGAVMEDRTVYLNDQVIQNMQVQNDYLDEEIDRQVQEIKRRISIYRPVSKTYNITARSVIVVDDGIATGATVMVVVKWIKQYRPIRLLVAVPVAPKDTVAELSGEGARIQVITTPVSFASVGQFYENFSQVTDDEVKVIARKWGLLK
ncbi:MAG TPA: phosphoribosyltransferase family protein [Nitrososphaeraceae archaeon]|nr:phosphoribosyltransferase family protein [Nitrososphaeraceae archaeon]